MKSLYIILAFNTTLLLSCKEKLKETDVLTIGTVVCQVQPYYVSKTGLNPKLAALSTSEKKIKGLVLVEYNQTDSGAFIGKTWQHPSWNKFGWMASIVTDDRGDSYITPAPVVSVLENPTDKQNTIYKVDGRTAEMKSFIDLPFPDSITHENAYGLLGLYFDCSAKTLYASSIAGSTREREKGIIYAIDNKTGTIIDQLIGMDAMGICVAGITGEKRLYAGSSRSSNVYSIELTADGKFNGTRRLEFSLDMLGPRGDDKARRLRIDKNGDMLVQGIEFNYNLIAAAEKQETSYRFQFNKETKKWESAK